MRVGALRGCSARCGSPCPEDQRPRSRPRYWTASDTCSAAILSHPARSAIVRATFRTRSWPRAERPRRRTAGASSRIASGGTGQKRRTWRPRAASTRAHRRRALAPACRQLGVGAGGHLEVKVNAVQERPGGSVPETSSHGVRGRCTGTRVPTPLLSAGLVAPPSTPPPSRTL